MASTNIGQYGWPILIGLLSVAVGAMVSLSPTGAIDQPSQQASRESITLSPVSKKHQIKPGDTVRGDFKVVNTGNTTYDFTVYARPFSVKDITYEQDFQTLTERSKAYSWVQFERAQWTIKPSETVEVEYTLRVPNNATPGGHYGVLFAETQPKEDTGDSVARKKRVGSVLRVSVDGDVKRSGEFVDSQVTPLQFHPPLMTTTSIKNTGNVDFDADMLLTVKDIFGNTKYRAQQELAIYPETTREINFGWDKANWFGLYRVEVNSKFLSTEETRESLVLLAPRWLLIVILIAVAGGGYALFRHRR